MRAVYLKKHLDWRHFNSFCGRKYNEEEIPQFEFQYKPRKMLATAFQLTNLEGVTWYLQSGICTTPIGHLYHTGHIYHIGHLLGIWKTSMLNDVQFTILFNFSDLKSHSLSGGKSFSINYGWYPENGCGRS